MVKYSLKKQGKKKKERERTKPKYKTIIMQ